MVHLGAVCPLCTTFEPVIRCTDECLWWDKEVGQCSILSIRDSLKVLEKTSRERER